jgi:hypothetical protein
LLRNNKCDFIVKQINCNFRLILKTSSDAKSNKNSEIIMHSAIGYITGRIRLCREEESLSIEEKEILSH